MPFVPDQFDKEPKQAKTSGFVPDSDRYKTAAEAGIPEERGLEDVPLLESFIAPIEAVGLSYPVLAGLEKFAIPQVAKYAGMLMPKTGAEMLGQLGLAGISGVGGELAARAVPEKYKKAKPYAREAGELLTGFSLPIAGELGARTVTKIAKPFYEPTVGDVTTAARNMEKRGYVLEPMQLRPNEPVASPGFMGNAKINEDLATKEVSSVAGKITNNINPSYVRERLQTAGEKLDQVFSGEIPLDQNLMQKVLQMGKFEAAVDPAGTRGVKSTAQNLFNRYQQAVVDYYKQIIENNFKQLTQAGAAKGAARGLQPVGGYQYLGYAKQKWPTLKTSDDPSNPEWFKQSVDTIKELSAKLGLPKTPDVFLGTSWQKGLYGGAHPEGWIIISDNVNSLGDPNGGLATALHEFGHQAEFQLFRNAPEETKNAIFRAYLDELTKIPLGTKTIRQLRPVTAEKYGPQAADRVVSKSEDSEYFRNFAEWFAEQTSRWLTQTKQPTNSVEKFFKKVSDSWKTIYQKVTGYTPLAPEVDAFMRANWNGESLNKVMTGNVEPSLTTQGAQLDNTPFELPPDFQFNISGKELQRLRSNLTDIARSSSDGNQRRAAADFVNVIDSHIENIDPKLADQLRKANRDYATAKLLQEGIEKGWISKSGKISLKSMGDYLANNTQGFGSGTSRHPLYQLGAEGRLVGLRNREQGADYQTQELARALLGRSKTAISSVIGGRTQAARAIQRRLAEGPLPLAFKPELKSVLPVTVAGGQPSSTPLFEEEE